MTSDRNELARILAEIDGLLVQAEEIAANPDDECQQSAIDFLIEFQETKRGVEARLRGE